MQIIYPFIDHVTRDKFIFVTVLAKPPAQALLAENFNMDQLEVALGGRNTVAFDSDAYLSGAMDTCFEETLAAPAAAAADATVTAPAVASS